MRLGLHTSVLSTVLAALGSAVHANEVPLEQWHLGINIGYGVMSNPLHGGDNVHLYLVPDVAYYTDTWYLDNNQVGYTFVNQDEHVLSAITEINPETRFFVDWHPSNVFALQAGSSSLLADSPARVRVDELDTRRWAFDAGFEYHYFTGIGQFQAKALADVSDVYRGWRAQASWRWGYRIGQWVLEPNIGINYSSSEQNDYFYGLSREETGGYGAIVVGSSIQPYAKIDVSYLVDEHNALRMHFGYIDYHTQAEASPLFKDSSSLTLFIGVKHLF
ncbi:MULTISPECIES: MipA/OmpV family protein [unclassified Pseudoalteromonas]|uniref:MipA/OmpV family protein n=1 Tax=unclassified Pseudoalteromonas TaxID=194690 RepID=UPI000CF5DB1F|nr:MULTISPECIES: MipA/OmpV family protein [unclassified Pseudoalteromonas]